MWCTVFMYDNGSLIQLKLKSSTKLLSMTGRC